MENGVRMEPGLEQLPEPERQHREIAGFGTRTPMPDRISDARSALPSTRSHPVHAFLNTLA